MDSPFSVRSLVLLVLLKFYLEKGANGADIVRAIAETSQGAIVLNPGTIYPVLKALVAEGCLQTIEPSDVQKRFGRPSIDYSLTEMGREQARVIDEMITRFQTNRSRLALGET